MLDLSNNNSTGHNFEVAYEKGGQRRLYLKRCEGVHYTDKTYPTLRTAALKAGFKVGAYDYLRPADSTPREAADYLLNLVVQPLVGGRDLRPALDCEDPHVTPSAKIGQWINETAKRVRAELGVRVVIYGSGWWLEACQFATAPGALWMAAFGRNDGKEYPVGRLPKPWKGIAAHQYSSQAHVIGINGLCDLSHVFVGAALDVPKANV